MNRRAFLFAGLATPVALSAAWAADVQMIYVGGQDCPYCRMWRDTYEKAWCASPDFGRVTWIEVDPPHLREAYQARHWPAELRAVLEQVPRKSGTPRFLIVKDGEIVSNELGVNKWEATLGRLQQVIG